MAFRVEISEDAENEGKGILDWLKAQHAGETGLRWFQGLQEAIHNFFSKLLGTRSSGISFQSRKSRGWRSGMPGSKQ